jgi:hypothetical protein
MGRGAGTSSALKPSIVKKGAPAWLFEKIENVRDAPGGK